MKQLHRGWVVILCLLLTFCLNKAALAAEAKIVESGDDGAIHWELDSNGKLTVSGTGTIEQILQVNYYSKKVKSIEIGDGITGIGSWSFANMLKTTKIIFGDNVQNIAYDAFMNCPNVQSVEFKGDKFQKDISFLGWMQSKKLKEVILPETAKYTIKSGMLMSKTGDYVGVYLGKTPDKLYIPEGVEQLEAEAFAEHGMREVQLPATLKSIGAFCFSRCKNLKSVVFTDITSQITVADADPGVFNGCKMTQLTLPPIFTDERTMYSVVTNCAALKALSIGEGTKLIRGGFIRDCKALETLYIPSSITQIDDNAIEYSPKLTLMVREGSCAETYAKQNGFKYAYFEPVTDIILSDSTLSLQKGKTAVLTAEIRPTDATEKLLIWCTSDPTVATVTKGKVKAVGEGKCDVICYAADGSCVRTVCHLEVIAKKSQHGN